jgi:hypothetical protein
MAKPPLGSGEWAYLAGVIDGEGSIMLRHHPPRAESKHRWEYWEPTMRVFNSDRRLMDWLTEHFGGGVSLARNNREQQKDCWIWSARTREIAELLTGLRPFLLLKAEQADVVLEYYATYRHMGRRGHPPALVERRREMAAMVKELNRRGKAA